MSFGSDSSERQQTSSSTSVTQRGFPEERAKQLSEFIEPRLREFTIPYAESRFLSKPIFKTVTVPGAPAGTPTTTIGRRQVTEGERAEYNALSKPYTYDPVLNEHYAMEPITTVSTTAAPDTTKQEIVGFEPSPRTYPSLVDGGLFAEQRGGIGNLGNYAVSRLGGTPSAEIGEGGLTAAAPGLFGLIGQQVEQNVLKPEEQRQLNLQDLLAAIKLGVQATGGSGSSVGQQFGTMSGSKTDLSFKGSATAARDFSDLMAAIGTFGGGG